MSELLTQKVDFDIIRYANCWEDADILLHGLSPEPGNKILSIGSAGDNSFSLLCHQPEVVVAVDVNETQLYLIALKKACFQNLAWEEILEFLGFHPSENRLKVFQSIKKDLSAAASRYWESNTKLIEEGVVFQGKFEKYFQFFCRKILPWIHSKATIEAFFKEKGAPEQEKFYHDEWNTWRWRLLFRIFFSKYVMGKWGRDPEFLRQVNGSVSRFVFEKAEKHLKTAEAQKNFILYFNLNGHFGNLLPHYLRRENYELIKQNLPQLRTVKGYAQQAIKEWGPFHCMNLSNIFEYMDEQVFAKTAEELVEGLIKDGKLAYWNLMVPRRISLIFPQQVVCEESISQALTQKDKGFFYSQFIIDKRV